MRTEIRWKAIQRITQGRLIHTMATCPLCSENRCSKTSWRPHKQDRAEGRVFAIDHGLSRAARPLCASCNDQPGREDPMRSEAALLIRKSSMPGAGHA
jgi:transposase-like protein